jgi:carbon-monoxide dehydrogenase medium subunit
MHPSKFDYHRATSVNEAISLAQKHSGAKFLAGGHSLIPILNLRLAEPEMLIDIGFIDDLKGITISRDGGCTIGALTTHAVVAANHDVPAALSQAAAMIGDPQVRNRGTVGGNVSHADPASDLPTVFSALEATFEISGPDGDRSVVADDFFLDLFMTALQDGEILKSIRIRSPHPGRMFNDVAGSAYVKMPNPASRYAMIGVAAVVTLRDNKCESASVALGGLTAFATRAPSVEAALIGQALGQDTLVSAAKAVQDDLGDDVLGDIHASAEYRRAIAPLLVEQALMKAAERAAR